ncbi:hypothetical protein [Balneatrix alpica]|uniref:hypothetical protein n=1 Tax=Balneatrix alpica TaxID=75684 RepID=UPI002738C6B6|nr:hypothetical protein [Balneatrix alpica]
MKLVSLSLSLLLISGCSSVENNVEDSPKNLHKVVAVANTEFDKNGGACADAIGVFEILHNKIVGSARDTFGRDYKVSGTIDADNHISGGFAITKITAVEYDGVISEDGDKANGTWKDLYNCSGAWRSQRVDNN